MSKLSDIVNVKISVVAPAVDSVSFDGLLIVGPPPSGHMSEELPTVAVYSDLQELIDAGYVATGDFADPIGIAARVAFSQNPKPAQIYVAVQKPSNPLISGGFVKIITADNALVEGMPIGTLDPAPLDLPWLQIKYNRLALSSLELEIKKDGAVVFTKALPTTEQVGAYA